MNKKHHKTLEMIFKNPVQSNVRWDDIEKLFEPYFSTKPEGTGLGLPLVKRIVEAHQGKISAYNMENGGACFEIIIPKES